MNNRYCIHVNLYAIGYPGCKHDSLFARNVSDDDDVFHLVAVVNNGGARKHHRHDHHRIHEGLRNPAEV